MKIICSLFIFLALCCNLSRADILKIASLHPLLTDMAQQIGGEQVELVNLLPYNGLLHSFEPSTAQVAAAAGAKLVLACGKGVEPYLPKLQESLNAKARIIELGKKVPDVMLLGTQQADPHWWNTPENMKRASLYLLEELVKERPEHEQDFQAKQRLYAAKMDNLTRQAKLKVARIPVSFRVLVTGHAAMTHFCDAFGFIGIPIYGIARDSEGDMARISGIMRRLRERHIGCIFTETNSSPKLLENIAEQIGATTKPLIMDGLSAEHRDFESLFLYNLNTITEGLMPPVQ